MVHLVEHVVFLGEEEPAAQASLRVAERVRVAFEVELPDAALARHPARAQRRARAAHLDRELGGGAHGGGDARRDDSRRAQEDSVADEQREREQREPDADAAKATPGAGRMLASDDEVLVRLGQTGEP